MNIIVHLDLGPAFRFYNYHRLYECSVISAPFEPVIWLVWKYLACQDWAEVFCLPSDVVFSRVVEIDRIP